MTPTATLTRPDRRPVDDRRPTSAAPPPDNGDPLAVLDAMLHGDRDLGGWLRARTAAPIADRIADRSYWHPNGFAKLVLHAADDHHVRLHVWPAGHGRRGETNPHGHRWDFASAVLAGEGLVEVTFAEHVLGRPYLSHVFAGGPESDALTSATPVGLEPVAVRVIGTADRYTVPTTAIHTVEPLGTSTVATLVVHGPRLRSTTMVYCASGRPVDEPGRPITGEGVRVLLDEVIGLLADLPLHTGVRR